MIKVLDLFSGTHSIGNCCEEIGWEVVSLDYKLPATHQIDILEFDYKQYPKNYFQVIWASPDCCFYSRLQNCWLGKKKADGILFTKEILEEKRKHSDKLIKKTLEIINYFHPELWFMENPKSGTLKDRDVVKGLPFYDVDYCMYSDWGYQKPTRIWTNKKDFKPLVCDKSGSCGNMIECKHKLNVANDVHTIGEKKKQKLHRERMGTSKTILEGDKIIRVNTAELRKKYKDNENIMFKGELVMKGTKLLDRFRVPSDLIFSLLLD